MKDSDQTAVVAGVVLVGAGAAIACTIIAHVAVCYGVFRFWQYCYYLTKDEPTHRTRYVEHEHHHYHHRVG
jgi:hypothetical protein